MKKRILSAFLTLTLCFGLLPVNVFAVGNEKSVSTPREFLDALKDTSITKITLTKDIMLPRPGTEGTFSGDASLMIRHDLVIDGGNHMLTIQNGGIVLGGDTTFQNISLSFVNQVRNAIIANGHKLTMDNVKNGSATLSLHLFCGTVEAYNSQDVLPAPGTHGSILLKGDSEVGEVFAGSFQDTDGAACTWNHDSTIVVEQGGGKLGTIHASGGMESRGQGTGDVVSGSYSKHPVTGTVSIEFNSTPDGKNPKFATVEGAASTDNAAVVVMRVSDTLFSPTLNNIGALHVEKGHVVPQNGNFAKVKSNDIKLMTNGQLGLNNMGDVLTLGTLDGGGTLILGERQKVTFTGNVTGQTKVAIGDVLFPKRPVLQHPYITAQGSAENAFSLIPNNSFPDDTLSRNPDGTWSVGGSGGAADQVILSDIQLGTPAVKDDKTSVFIPATASFAANSATDLSQLPYQAREASQSQPVSAVLEADVYVCTIPTGKGSLRLEFGTFETESGAYADGLSVTPVGENTIPAGTYNLKITIAPKNCEDKKTRSLSTSFTIAGDSAGQLITADDVSAVYGDTGVKITAATSGSGVLSYGIKNGAPTDIVDVDAKTGALTIKKAGTTTVTVTAAQTAQHAAASKDVTVTIAKKDISGAQLNAVNSQPYIGSAIQPKPGFAQLSGLTEGNDFTYTYRDNQFVGTAVVEAVGQNNYTGTAHTTFSITPQEQTLNITPTAGVQMGGKLLDLKPLVTQAKGTVHFEISGGSAASGATLKDGVLTSGNVAGDILISVTVDAVDENQDGTAEYSGRVQQNAITVTVADKKVEPLTVTQNDVTYGKQVAPQVQGAPAGTPVTLTYRGVAGTQYGPTSTAPVNVGSYEVTAECEAADVRYMGSAAFHILRKDISSASVVLGQSPIYTGTQLTQAVNEVAVDGLAVTYDITGNAGTDAGSYTLTLTGKGNFTGTKKVNWTIDRAAASASMKTVSGYIQASHAGAVTLPVLPEGARYGDIKADPAVIDAKITSGVLHYTGENTVRKDQQYVVLIPVTNAKNYEDYTITVTLIGSEKKVPFGAPKLSTKTIVYGQQLNTIELSGSLKYENMNVPGTFVWTNGNDVPNAGTYTGEWKFTPADTSQYVEVTGTALITVNKAKPSGTPSYKEINTSGKTLKDANLAIGTITPAGGTIKWKLADSTEVKKNTSYAWEYTPKLEDQGNYEKLTGSVVPYTSGGGSSHKPADKIENTTNSDGSTTTTVTKPDGTVIRTTKHTDGSTTSTTTKKDGSSVTDIKQKNGTTAKISVDKHGEKQTGVKFSKQAVSDAEKMDQPMRLPIPAVQADTYASRASVITVEVPRDTKSHITVPVSQPNPGIVAVLVHADGTEEVVRKCVTDHTGVSLAVEGDVALKIVDKSKRFVDVADAHWASDSVKFVTARGIYNGTSDNTFSPSNTMTRGMLTTVLYNLESNPAHITSSQFTDVAAGAWYSDAVQWANEKGIVSGYANGKFNPQNAITREQLAVMIYRYAGSPKAPERHMEFSDAGQIGDFAKEAIRWAVSNGIMDGNGDGTLNPKGTATRAQTATILMRFMEQSAK